MDENIGFKEYLAGLVAGDGSIYYYHPNKEYFIYIYDNNLEFLNMIKEKVLTLLGLNAYIVKPCKDKNYYRLQICNKNLYFELKNLIKKFLEDNMLSINFIKGFTDAEGSLYFDRKIPVISISNKNKIILDKIKIFCKEHNIKAKIYGYYLYKLIIRNKDALNFLSLVKPLHPKFRKSPPLP